MTHTIRLLTQTSKARLLDRFASELSFPSYFGRNWDAFYDCITDLSWLKEDDVNLVVEGADYLANRIRTDLEEALEDAVRTGGPLKSFRLVP